MDAVGFLVRGSTSGGRDFSFVDSTAFRQLCSFVNALTKLP